jgi:hypothetical protein
MTIFDGQVFMAGIYAMGVLLMWLTEYEFYFIQDDESRWKKKLTIFGRSLLWPAVTAYRGIEFIGYLRRMHDGDFVLSPMEERQVREYGEPEVVADDGDVPILEKLQRMRGETVGILQEIEDADGKYTWGDDDSSQ